MTTTTETLRAALNRLAHWRAALAGWQLGTRPSSDPECQAVRDHRESSLMLRAEVTALTRILLEKGVMTVEEFQATLEEEADALSEMLANRFPGITATDTGLTYDSRVMETMKGWKK